ncbi:MAG TPA: DnaJ domain-containing protein [Longimicrobiales bacterium]|nr:DnaJ domain-containing protein [Longimicrobiales bacterium]
MTGPDYYALLGVSRDADFPAIKRAYRRLALRYHPDRRGGDPSAAEAFRLVAEAYRVLSDPDKRGIYDRFGGTGLTIREGAAADLTMADALETFVRDFGAFNAIGSEAAAAAEAALRAAPARKTREQRAAEDPPAEAPAPAPGAHSGRSGPAAGWPLRDRRRTDTADAPTPGDARTPPGLRSSRAVPVRTVAVTLEDVASGLVRAIKPPCGACRGTGERRGELQRACDRCDGEGEVDAVKRGVLGPVRERVRCSTCGGTGRRPLPPCPACRGSGDLPNSRPVGVEIPAGVKDGARIRAGHGEDALEARVQVLEHARFVRIGDDLQAELPLTFSQAALGAVMDVPTLSARDRVRVPPGTQPGDELRVAGAGLPDPEGGPPGDLLLRTTLTVPRKLRREERKLLRELDIGTARIGGLRYVLPAAALLLAMIATALWYWQRPMQGGGAGLLAAAGPPVASSRDAGPREAEGADPPAGSAADAGAERGGDAGADEAAATAGIAGSPPSNATEAPARRLVVGGASTCVADETDRLRCWGSSRGPLRLAAIPRGGAPRSVAVGMRHACYADAAGALACWGANDAGQLGDGGTRDRRGPWPVRGPAPFVEADVGASHTCALDERGAVSCWGAIAAGSGAPGAPLDERSYASMVSGWSHACALDPDGYAWCWGGNRWGQVGDGTTRDRDAPVPVALDAPLLALDAGSGHTCGVARDGGVWCWGRNDAGQLGVSGGAPAVRPVAVDAPVRFVFVTVGARHSCALDEEARAWCWGANGYGQLGTGDTEPRARPSPVRGRLQFRSIAAGAAHACGETTDGRVVCWGANVAGQLGDALRGNHTTPVLLPGE